MIDYIALELKASTFVVGKVPDIKSHDRAFGIVLNDRVSMNIRIERKGR